MLSRGEREAAKEMELCGADAGKLGVEPCVREPDHEGGHWFWTHSTPESGPMGRAHVGIWVFDTAAEDGKAWFHADFAEGVPSAEEVAALCAIIALKVPPSGPPNQRAPLTPPIHESDVSVPSGSEAKDG